MYIHNKKGLSTLSLIAALLVVMVLVIIASALIIRSLTSQGNIIGSQISGVKDDVDGDGTLNALDKCPCTAGEIQDEGCPALIAFIDEAEFQEFKREELRKYNSQPRCGIVEGQIATPTDTEETQKPAEPSTEAGSETQFKKYQSIEIFGGDDNDPDPEEGSIQQACVGWVGGTGATSCHSEDDDCDGNFNTESLKDGCWIMASEDDDLDPNDCGQTKFANGQIISLSSSAALDADLDTYQSVVDEDEPKNLFRWSWKSKPEYGALLCNNGFWHGCKAVNEGKTMAIQSQNYKCSSSEWVKV